MNFAASLERFLSQTIYPFLRNIGNLVYYAAIVFLLISTIVSTSYVMFTAFREGCNRLGFTKWFINKAALKGGDNVDLQTIGYVMKNIVLLNVCLLLGVFIFKWIVYEGAGIAILDFILNCFKNF